MRVTSHFGKSVAIFIIILIASYDFAKGQTSVDVGFSIGFNRHTFNIEDDIGILLSGIALAGTYGLPVVIRRSNWELHTGFYENNLSHSFYFSTRNGATYGRRSYSSGLSTFKIPVHIGRTLNWTDGVNLSPQLGFSWLTSQRTGLTGTGGATFVSSVEYETVSRAVNKNKFMAEAGLDLNISLFRSLILSIGAHYSLGLQTIEKIEVTYHINDQTYQGTVNSRGSGWKFNAGLKLPLYSW